MAQPPPESLLDRLRRLRARETAPTRIRLLEFLLADTELHDEATVTSRSTWPEAAALLDRTEGEPSLP